MKSNASASTHQQRQRHERRVDVHGQAFCRHHAFDDVGHVLAAVGGGLEQLVDGLQLDELPDIGLGRGTASRSRVRITRSARDSMVSISRHWRRISGAFFMSARAAPRRPAGARSRSAAAAPAPPRALVTCCTSYSDSDSAESCIRSSTSSMREISRWMSSRSSGVTKMVCSSAAVSCVMRSASCSRC